jgi:hypothetical protein
MKLYTLFIGGYIHGVPSARLACSLSNFRGHCLMDFCLLSTISI